MKITELLREEHMHIYRFLQVMESISAYIQSGKEINTGHLELLINIMQVYFEKNHNTREEQYLFPYIPELSTSSPCGPFSLIMAAHSMFPACIRDIIHVMERIREGKPDAVPEFQITYNIFRTFFSNHRLKDHTV